MEYGILQSRNIDRVALGDHEFDTWYGNAAYFAPNDHTALAVESSPKKQKRRLPEPAPHLWLDKLHVCEMCFKYLSNATLMKQHRLACTLRTKYPPIGKLMYRDLHTPYLIKQVRGFRHQLFCQNLCLFGKLFLDDKSVYYNVDHFDFYVLYGSDNDMFVPMGFFSKEVNAWDSDNNLACICVFPPYQRHHAGSLLIEFSYALAKYTPGQKHSGPEFPLSPYGKLTYLRFWSKKLAHVLVNQKGSVTVLDLADITGFRKHDVLLTLEFMEVLKNTSSGVKLMTGNLRSWCKKQGLDPTVERSLLNPEYLIL